MNNWIKWVLCFCLLTLPIIAGGCEGTDTREKVDDTVEEMTGKKDVERYKELKDDLKTIQNQQENRYRQLDEEQEKE
jgi:hypothetical protein